MSKRSSKGPRNAPSHHGAAPATGSARPGMIWALLAAAILAWFVPFVFWDADVLRTFDASAVLLSACALVAVTSLVFDRESVGPTLSRAAVAWSVFLAWLLLAGAVSGRPWAAFVGESTGRLGWASLVCVTLIAVAASARADGLSRALSSVAPWLVGSQAIVVAGQLLAGRTARGTFPNSSYLAEALLLVLPWTVHAAGAAVQRRPWRIAVGALGVVTLAIAGARVGLVVAATWYGWQVVSDSELTRAARRWVVAGVALMAVAGAFAFAGGEIASVLGPAAFGDRPSMWRLGAAAVAARPVFGWGPTASSPVALQP